MKSNLRRKSVRPVMLYLLACLFLALVWQPVRGQAASGRIAFVSDQDGSPKVYTMLPDGSDVQMLGDGSLEAGGHIISLAISPDGSKAAFISEKNRDGVYPTFELFLRDLVTGNVTQLTDNGLDKANVLWLSDSRIVYLNSGVEPNYGEVALMSLETGQSRIIIDSRTIGYSLGEDFGVSIREISISPDRQEFIVYGQTSLPDAYNVLVMMNVDGTNIHQITSDDQDSFDPVWSMDANIVYYGCEFDDYHEICRLDLQTSESQIVTDLRNSLPQEQYYSITKMDITPDNRILFQLLLSNTIYSLNPDDGSITAITEGDTPTIEFLGWVNSPLETPMPTDTPTSQSASGRIAFVSDQDGSPKVYTMLPDGSDVQMLGDGILEEGGNISSVTISPDGSKAAFVSRKDRDGIYPADQLFLLDFATGNVTQLTDNGPDKANVIWLSDSSIVYLSGGFVSDYREVSLMSLETGQSQVIVDGRTIAPYLGEDFEVSIRQISISPDKQQLIVGVHTGLPDAYSVLVMLNMDGTNIHRVTSFDVQPFSPVWSMDANIVYYGCGFDDYHEICRLNLQTSESQIMTDLRNSLPGESEHYIHKMNISPDNRIILQLSWSNNIYSLNPGDGSITHITEGDTPTIEFLGWVNPPLETPTPTDTPTSQSASGRIAFVSDQDGSPKVYTMLLDGSDVQLLGDGILEVGGDITSVTISPDGSKVAFISGKNRDGIFPADELFLLDFATGNVTQLTNDSPDKANVLWLSDSRIVYLDDGFDPDYGEVVLMSLETGQSQVIVDSRTIGYSLGEDFGVSIREISFSPDRQQFIVYGQTSLPDAYNVLVMMNVDGTNIHQITSDDQDSFDPVWSMDANIVYHGCGFDGYHEICRLNLQTSESQILTDLRHSLPGERKHYIDKMTLSPDNQILFQLSRSNTIYSLNPDDGSITNITEGDTPTIQFLGWVNPPIETPTPTDTPTAQGIPFHVYPAVQLINLGMSNTSSGILNHLSLKRVERPRGMRKEA